MRQKIFSIACAAAAVIGTTMWPSAAHADAPVPLYQVVNRQWSECLDVWNAATEHAANVGVSRCVGADNQLWYREFAVSDSTGTYYYIKAAHTRMCLNVADFGQADGKSDIVQATCSGGTNEQWRMKDMGDGNVQLIARHSQRCADKAWSGDVVQWTCWGSGDWWQHWRFAATGRTVEV